MKIENARPEVGEKCQIFLLHGVYLSLIMSHWYVPMSEEEDVKRSMREWSGNVRAGRQAGTRRRRIYYNAPGSHEAGTQNEAIC